MPAEPVLFAPRTRLLCVLLFVGVVASLRDLKLLVVLSSATLALCLLCPLGCRLLLKRLGLVMLGGGFFLVLVLLGQPGEVLWQVGWLRLTREGLTAAGLAGLRLLASASAVVWLSGSLGDRNLFAAFYGIGLPPLLVRQLLFTWRYLHVLASESLSLWRAAASRGFAPGGGLWHRSTFQTLGLLIGALLLRSLARSERVSLSVAARGFGGLPPLVRQHAGLGCQDLVPGLAMVAMAALLIWLDRGGLWLILSSWK